MVTMKCELDPASGVMYLWFRSYTFMYPSGHEYMMERRQFLTYQGNKIRFKRNQMDQTDSNDKETLTGGF